jgi:hypothetical protein
MVRAVRTRLLEANSEAKPRAPMDPALRRQLIDEFTPEVERLGRLIGRDLSAWLDAGDHAVAQSSAPETATSRA